ncbi:hypothetical protein AB1Y20_018954 [Prymnesium parvum]|uniref:HAD family hydrolase n=1 Tax=Prymnesium parvum TaxID=97485 RepID=A0AB34JQ33_PRYPA
MLLLLGLSPRAPPCHRRTPSPAMRSPPPSPVIALDLDGVLVDSQAERLRSAWRTARALWPDAFDGIADVVAQPWRGGARRAWAGGEWGPLQGVGAEGLPNWLDAKLRRVWPVVGGSSDAVLLMRLCADEAAAAIKTDNGARPLSVGEIATNWDDELREVLLSRYGLPREELLRRYDQVRTEWLENDLDGWVEAHSFHSDAVAALRALVAEEKGTVYALSSEHARYVTPLLRQVGVELEPSLIIQLDEDEQKGDALHQLRERHPQEQLVVVDDNAAALRNIAADRRLFGAQLWFAAWGYSTPQQQALVATMPRVRTLGSASSLHEVFGTASDNADR